MKVSFALVCVLLSGAACSSSTAATPSELPARADDPDRGDADGSRGAEPTDGGDASPGARPTIRVRVAAANTTSGASTSYDAAESIRIFQGLRPDVALIQELRYGAGTDAELRDFVTTAFGASYHYYREPTGDMPNGIVSRHPIRDSGSWDDPHVDNRGFAWAKIEIPGAPRPLWAISVHFLTTNATSRDAEAKALVAQIAATVPAGDYLVIGGDLNTSARSEPCVDTLSQAVVTNGPYPEDGQGNDLTNAPRSKPYDWLLADEDLSPLSVPTSIGARSFPAGLVFDSRVYEPLSDVAPIVAADSDAPNMQHMPVVREFAFPL